MENKKETSKEMSGEFTLDQQERIRDLFEHGETNALTALKVAWITHAGDASASTISFGEDSLELIFDEAMSEDTQKAWLVGELWALIHGAQYTIDIEGTGLPERIKLNTKLLLQLQPSVIGRVDDELKTTEEWTNHLQGASSRGCLIGEEALEELEHRLHGVRCALEEVKAGEVK